MCDDLKFEPGAAHCALFACAARTQIRPIIFVALILSFLSTKVLADGANTLRVLKLRNHELNHPHRNVAGEFRLLADFAHREQLRLVWIDAVHPAELEQMLAGGVGDVAIADLGVRPDLNDELLPTLALGNYRYMLYGRSDVTANSPLDLAGMRVGVAISSPLWPYLHQLESSLPGFQVVVMPDDSSRDELLRGIASAAFDAAVVPVGTHEVAMENWPRVKLLFALSGQQPALWHVAERRPLLRERLNAYLLRSQAAVLSMRSLYGDLDAIRERHVLRVITRLDPQNYYIRNGELTGFEFEWVRAFARRHGLSLEFFVAETDQEIVDWLRRGIGDIVTTRIDSARVRADPGIESSWEYFHSPSVIAAGANRYLTVDGLHGARVAVIANSVQHRELGALVARGAQIEPLVIQPREGAATLGRLLADGRVDAAIVDAYAIPAVRQADAGIRIGASLSVAFKYAWTMRAQDVKLIGEVNEFLLADFRLTTYNVLAERYLQRFSASSLQPVENLSPYDDLIRQYADPKDFDWRLIVALMYLESRFDPLAESTAGARGLMQLQPRTAQALGALDPFDPETAIRAGIAYLDRLRNRFADVAAPRERTWFAIAAYNAGYKRVQDARRRASREGLDQDRWFGHVESIMRRISREGGTCRCGQTVAYVRAIRMLYNTYNRVQERFTAVTEEFSTRPPG